MLVVWWICFNTSWGSLLKASAQKSVVTFADVWSPLHVCFLLYIVCMWLFLSFFSGNYSVLQKLRYCTLVYWNSVNWRNYRAYECIIIRGRLIILAVVLILILINFPFFFHLHIMMCLLMYLFLIGKNHDSPRKSTNLNGFKSHETLQSKYSKCLKHGESILHFQNVCISKLTCIFNIW